MNATHRSRSIDCASMQTRCTLVQRADLGSVQRRPVMSSPGSHFSAPRQNRRLNQHFCSAETGSGSTPSWSSSTALEPRDFGARTAELQLFRDECFTHIRIEGNRFCLICRRQDRKVQTGAVNGRGHAPQSTTAAAVQPIMPAQIWGDGWECRRCADFSSD